MATQRCAFIAAGNEVPDPFGIVRDFALKLDGPVRFMLLAAFIFYADFHPNRIHITPNAAAQARRARDACYGTETPSRRCLKQAVFCVPKSTIALLPKLWAPHMPDTARRGNPSRARGLMVCRSDDTVPAQDQGSPSCMNVCLGAEGHASLYNLPTSSGDT